MPFLSFEQLRGLSSAKNYYGMAQGSWHNTRTHTHTHTHTFNGPLSGTTRMSQYQEGKTNLDFTGARDSEWQWHQLGHMQVCTSLQTDNHTSTSPLSFLQAGCTSCCPTNSIKALKAKGSWHKGIRKYKLTSLTRANVLIGTLKLTGWMEGKTSHPQPISSIPQRFSPKTSGTGPLGKLTGNQLAQVHLDKDL